MLAGTAEPALSMGELHLQLALSSIQVHDVPEVTHHLEHFVAHAGEHEAEGVQVVLEHIEAGDEREAEHAIIELLESMGHEQHHHD